MNGNGVCVGKCKEESVSRQVWVRKEGEEKDGEARHRGK
jgi:hypothetical protein